MTCHVTSLSMFPSKAFCSSALDHVPQHLFPTKRLEYSAIQSTTSLRSDPAFRKGDHILIQDHSYGANKDDLRTSGIACFFGLRPIACLALVPIAAT